MPWLPGRGPVEIVETQQMQFLVHTRSGHPIKPTGRTTELTSNRPNALLPMAGANIQHHNRVFCENMYCETPVGHTKADCFSYGGGKAGKYPENFHGKRDVHLAPEARIAARRKQAMEGSGMKRSDAGNRFLGMADYTEDTEEDVDKVIERVEDGFVFMMTLSDGDEDDEIAIDEEVRVDTIICNTILEQDDSINHDTGVSCHIFHKREVLHDYTPFESPLVVHAFRTSLMSDDSSCWERKDYVEVNV
ncbi:hypothetical protein DFH07DRAFT_764194 [Mycena maculata]|uniref:Uncharacterized protein n=1 Tax=Mycena maculata TaxID=230809 RepID=A0AAD7KE53_9AGAR|nr:hypothetical protein DFH07DRAFT_764194 [Mycena maculata]